MLIIQIAMPSRLRLRTVRPVDDTVLHEENHTGGRQLEENVRDATAVNNLVGIW